MFIYFVILLVTLSMNQKIRVYFNPIEEDYLDHSTWRYLIIGDENIIHYYQNRLIRIDSIEKEKDFIHEEY
jgi:hypothetical protein